MVSTNNGLPIIDEASNESLSMDTLSQEETRKILTPFAFEIDKSLFGIPLAFLVSNQYAAVNPSMKRPST